MQFEENRTASRGAAGPQKSARQCTLVPQRQPTRDLRWLTLPCRKLARPSRWAASTAQPPGLLCPNPTHTHTHTQAHLLKLAAVAHHVECHGVDHKALPRVLRDEHLDVRPHAHHLCLARPRAPAAKAAAGRAAAAKGVGAAGRGRRRRHRRAALALRGQPAGRRPAGHRRQGDGLAPADAEHHVVQFHAIQGLHGALGIVPLLRPGTGGTRQA